ncbi:MAG: hypothetical protein Q8P20_06555 [bacterium]|nr:hypothetical protein [bacterium]
MSSVLIPETNNSVKQAFDKMYAKLEAMDDNEILSVWEALNHVPDNFESQKKKDMWDRDAGITMDEWAEAVFSEKSKRNI